MQRYFIELAYNGKDFYGWQIQPNEISVQEVIEQALFRLHSNTGYKVLGCGRTDTGVHAHHFVLHVDLPKIDDYTQFLFKMNSMLPDSVALQSVCEVDAEKHARFDATSRTYRYFIHWEKDPFLNDRSWEVRHAPNFEAMNEAAKHLIGKQDFTSLSKIHTDVKTNICDVRKAEWTQTSETSAYFEITADRFLRNMVRATVGTLMDVGHGKIEVQDLKTILEAKDRQAASTSVPAHGLFLWQVEY